MKKLAMALLCLFSVAFLASCDPEVIENPEPSIEVLVGDGYLTDGQVIEMYEVYSYGFGAASNALTMKELTNLRIVCGETVLCDTNINCTEFSYRGEIYFDDQEKREIVGEAEIIATVTDAAGKTNSAKISISVNKEDALEEENIEWVKWGHDVPDLTAYGLEMQANNWKDVNVHIYPAEGSTLYVIENDSENWYEAIETASNLAGLFYSLAETSTAVEDYKNISCNNANRYDDVLVTKDANGDFHAIHITGSEVEVVLPAGTKIIVYGKAK